MANAASKSAPKSNEPKSGVKPETEIKEEEKNETAQETLNGTIIKEQEKPAQETSNDMIIEEGEDLECEKVREKVAVIVKFQLGSSQYATMALRELMKQGGVQTFKPEFGSGR